MRSFLELRKRKITTSYSLASQESVVLGRVYLEKLDSKSPLEILMLHKRFNLTGNYLSSRTSCKQKSIR